ncbi:MAG: glucose-6-phosphate isomerase [Nitrospinota bacterium]|nr:glucose-6-phosphate isomerase [Nitrospinota bacterium]
MINSRDILVDYTNMLEKAIGGEHGISEKEITEAVAKTPAVHSRLNELRTNGTIGFFDLASNDTAPLIKFARKIREKYENLVVLGIGGSALGASAVQSALNPSFYNLLARNKRKGFPRLFVADNIDPDWFDEVLSIADPKKTIYNVISKSGTTAETMSQFMVVFDLLRSKLKGKWKKRVVITTDAKNGILREIVDEFGLESFEIPANVGGRFSVFTPVGLLPLACAGIDINLLLDGASRMAERCSSEKFNENPAYILGALHYLADVRKGKSSTVMMPYSTKLYGVADWFRQLWAESLGKAKDLQGKQVNTGQTPIKALGVTDQHSQVQLYVEGPNDKMFVFLEIENFSKEVVIPEVFEDKAPLKYLAGKSLNKLIKTEMEGTEYALTTHNRPSMTIKLPELNAHTLGQLMFMLEAATAYAGGLYGIDPFDQPGVEFGKKYTYAMMGREGFEKMRSELETGSGSVKRRTV